MAAGSSTARRVSTSDGPSDGCRARGVRVERDQRADGACRAEQRKAIAVPPAPCGARLSSRQVGGDRTRRRAAAPSWPRPTSTARRPGVSPRSAKHGELAVDVLRDDRPARRRDPAVSRATPASQRRAAGRARRWQSRTTSSSASRRSRRPRRWRSGCAAAPRNHARARPSSDRGASAPAARHRPRQQRSVPPRSGERRWRAMPAGSRGSRCAPRRGRIAGGSRGRPRGQSRRNQCATRRQAWQ